MSAGDPGDRRALTEEQFREWTRPRLMLFLSADLENSTRLKQRSSEQGEWLRKVFSFISRFPTEFQASREKLAVEEGWQETPAPANPWKVLGDEVIFAVEIHSRPQPRREIAAFARTLERWNSGPHGTTVKGASWMAGFPVANKIVPVVVATGSGDSGTLVPDYIGPSMDAGFRLSRNATSRRLILSVEAAWWILQEGAGTEAEGENAPALHFQGCLPYKGLAEETGYPLIWTWVNEPGFQKFEDTLLGRRPDGRVPELRQLCEAFIREFGVPRHLPFLEQENFLNICPADGRTFADHVEEARELMRGLCLIEGTPESGGPGRKPVNPKSLLTFLKQSLEEEPEPDPEKPV